MLLVVATVLDSAGPDQWFSNVSVYQNHMEGILKHRYLGPPQSFLSQWACGWGLRNYISNRPSDDAIGYRVWIHTLG